MADVQETHDALQTTEAVAARRPLQYDLVHGAGRSQCGPKPLLKNPKGWEESQLLKARKTCCLNQPEEGLGGIWTPPPFGRGGGVVNIPNFLAKLFFFVPIQP